MQKKGPPVEQCGWRAIVVTCTSTKVREALEEECRRLSDGGLLPKHDFLFVVDDPRPENEVEMVYPGKLSGVGSGGATINALLVAVERLSAYSDYTTVNGELVYTSKILVVHHGRSLVHSPGGSAFLHIDAKKSSVPSELLVTPVTLLQHSIWMATKVGANSLNGVWVISLDSFLSYSPTLQPLDTDGLNGAVVCTVRTPLDHAQHHGVVLSGQENSIAKMHYKLPLQQLEELFPDRPSLVISGLVFLSSSLAEKLLGLHMLTPLDRCTYYGTDSGITPLQVSLYFDILAPLCSEVEEEEYLLGQCGATYNRTANYTLNQQESKMARLQIWKVLQGQKAQYHILEGVIHHYLSSELSFKESVWPILPCFGTLHSKRIKDFDCLCKSTVIEGTVTESKSRVTLIDSWIGKNVTLNCNSLRSFSGFYLRNENSVFDFPTEIVWQCYSQEERSIVVAYGYQNKLSIHHENADATVFNETFLEFLEKTRIDVKDLWPQTEEKYQTLLNAKLYMTNMPVLEQMEMLSLMSAAVSDSESQQKWLTKLQLWKDCPRISMFEVSKLCDLKSMGKMREMIHFEAVKTLIHVTSDDTEGESLLSLFQYVASRGLEFVNGVLKALHQELETPRESTSRLLANVADLLGCLAKGRGGLRSGPAAHALWKSALVELKAGNQKQSMDQMLNICQEWIASGQPENLIRAARHYERASQIVISCQVETAQLNVDIRWELPELKQQVKLGEWVEALSPARLDLAGGWSDTPPICYEQGGAVLNIAIKVNGKKPIGAKVRFVSKPCIRCTLRDWSGGDLLLTWTELDELRDYDNPVAQGALVKAVLLYCQALDLANEETLASQLEEKFGGGIELEVWSMLPKGSGLGGSSLLAGTIIAALAVLFGHPTPKYSDIIHATLVIEQRLTTGGGWQDQVGGLIGGAKLGVSKKGVPLTVNTYKIPLSQDVTEMINDRLLLLYTGKVRLARNLLQTVIRNWYARDPTVIKCFAELQEVAVDGARAMMNGNLQQLGSYIDQYWNLKKKIASGCEPLKVSKLMACLRDHCHGISLAGAGGGGYLYAMKKESGPLPENIDLGDLSCDMAEIDQQGLEIKRNGEFLPQIHFRNSTIELWTDHLESSLFGSR